jgi:lysophospholipase L1-like esterase
LRRFQRYVAIGDSTTEGLDDPDGRGGYRGWADRLAERIARHQGALLYANLAVRGLTARQIRERQLEAALELEPDLASVVVGMNDLIRPSFDLAAVVGELEALMGPLRDQGATVLTITLPDLSPIMPLARVLSERTRRLNDAFRTTADRFGALLLDLAAQPLSADPRLWSHDRLHANALGHERMGHALARTLGLPGDDGWALPLPPMGRPTRRQRLAGEVRWARGYLLPWVVRNVMVRAEQRLAAKRPQLIPVQVP